MKEHKKMYKAGKNWVVATLAVATLAVAAPATQILNAGSTTVTAHADVTPVQTLANSYADNANSAAAKADDAFAKGRSAYDAVNDLKASLHSKLTALQSVATESGKLANDYATALDHEANLANPSELVKASLASGEASAQSNYAAASQAAQSYSDKISPVYSLAAEVSVNVFGTQRTDHLDGASVYAANADSAAASATASAVGASTSASVNSASSYADVAADNADGAENTADKAASYAAQAKDLASTFDNANNNVSHLDNVNKTLDQGFVVYGNSSAATSSASSSAATSSASSSESKSSASDKTDHSAAKESAAKKAAAKKRVAKDKKAVKKAKKAAKKAKSKKAKKAANKKLAKAEKSLKAAKKAYNKLA